MAHMVDATVQLLRERTPEQITVRDVAEASGHHHRFVQAWFGGKVGLFRAAFDRILEESATRIGTPFFSGEGFGPEARLAATLMNWLVAAEPGALDGPRPTPIIDQVTEIYRESFGLPRDLARLMALRVVSGSLALTLFPGPLGVTPDDLSAMIALERELTQLLADARRTA
jgi:AcrR family transcriptional regulator